MRHFKEIRNEEEKKIQFSLYDERIEDPARCDVDLKIFDEIDEEKRTGLRERAREKLERELDKRVAQHRPDDKIMTEEEWRALVPHESEAEVPPVPTYGKIIDYVYETALKKLG